MSDGQDSVSKNFGQATVLIYTIVNRYFDECPVK